MAAKANTNKSSKGKGNADKPSKSKKQKLESEEPTSASDSASTYEQGSDDESVAVASAQDTEDDDEAASDSDLDDEEEQPSRKSKGGSSTPKKRKGKDDLNTRVVKQVKKVKGPKEDPATPVILPTTMDFLKELVDHNDREWFQENDARYRHALANFTAFIQAWVPLASEADWSLPHLPAKELIQRIYRDVRFSKDKTPYKTNMSASHSRTGRKGPFAFYYLQIAPKSSKNPRGGSMLAAGYWGPSSENTKAIREQIINDSAPLRKILQDDKFCKYFGAFDPRKGSRTNVFGADDALKKAPKMEGVTKEHPEIDLLKLRSIGVSHYFTDDEVKDEDFLKKHLIPCMEVAAPFVQYLNDVTHPPPSDDEDEDGDQNGGGSEQAGSASAPGEGGEEEDEE